MKLKEIQNNNNIQQKQKKNLRKAKIFKLSGLF